MYNKWNGAKYNFASKSHKKRKKRKKNKSLCLETKQWKEKQWKSIKMKIVGADRNDDVL